MNNEAPRPAGMEATGTGEELKLRIVEGRQAELNTTAVILGVCVCVCVM